MPEILTLDLFDVYVQFDGLRSLFVRCFENYVASQYNYLDT